MFCYWPIYILLCKDLVTVWPDPPEIRHLLIMTKYVCDGKKSSVTASAISLVPEIQYIHLLLFNNRFSYLPMSALVRNKKLSDLTQIL